MGVTAIQSTLDYLDVVLELFRLESAKDMPTPSALAHQEKVMTGELQESAEVTVNRQRVGRLIALHTGQSRRTVCGVFSGNDAREANPRVDDLL